MIIETNYNLNNPKQVNKEVLNKKKNYSNNVITKFTINGKLAEKYVNKIHFLEPIFIREKNTLRVDFKEIPINEKIISVGYDITPIEIPLSYLEGVTEIISMYNENLVIIPSEFRKTIYDCRFEKYSEKFYIEYNLKKVITNLSLENSKLEIIESTEKLISFKIDNTTYLNIDNYSLFLTLFNFKYKR